MKTITVNGRIYKAKEFDFNMMSDLQEMGIELGSKTGQMPLLRAYVASCMDTTKEVAGKELEQHILKSGDITEALKDIMEVMSEMLDESDFFRAISENKEEEAPQSSRKAKVSK